MSFTYKQLDQINKTISVILKAQSLTWNERKQFNVARLGISKAISVQEALYINVMDTFQYMSKLDLYKDEKKAKELIIESQNDLKAIFDEEINYVFVPFDFNNGFVGEGAASKMYIDIALSIDGTVINYLEPK